VDDQKRIQLAFQRDILISRKDQPASTDPAQLPHQSIGTVLGHSYPTLQPPYDANQLQCGDARNQEQVLDKLLAGR
jgi:polar amino acid transport system substrate-binding protein